MNIIGYNPNSFVDFPQNISAVIFIGGCNFTCWYCHNKDFIYNKGDYDEDKILANIAKNADFLDAVTITGGEPTMEKIEDLKALIKKIKDLGLKVKLDTNGTHPEKLEQLAPLLDYIAMDIKAPWEKYNLITAINDKMLENIKKSVEIIKTLDNYEFRTTFSPDLNKEDIIEIANNLKAAKIYYIQQFRAQNEHKNRLAHSPEYIKETLEESNKILPTRTRGI